MKRLILIFLVIVFLAGCASNNLFEKNVSYSNICLKKAKTYCQKHADKADYNACMDKEYFCALEVGVITGGDNLSKAETREANRKSTAILKKNNIWKKFHGGNCSYCEILEIYKREW